MTDYPLIIPVSLLIRTTGIGGLFLILFRSSFLCLLSCPLIELVEWSVGAVILSALGVATDTCLK